MKRIKNEFYRVYFRYLIWSTDRLIARKQAIKARADTVTDAKVIAAHGPA